MASKYVITCQQCGEEHLAAYTSPTVGSRRDINCRVVLGSKESGISHPRLKTLFAVMNIAAPLHHSTYNDISREVHVASVNAADKLI